MRNSILILVLFLPVYIQAQLVQRSSMDTILGHKIIKDKNGIILPWYKPNVEGAAYIEVSRLASEFMINSVPNDPTTGLPFYLVTCCFYKGEGKLIPEAWPHNPACVYAGSVQSFAIDYRNYTGDDRYIELVRLMLDYQLENGTTPAGWIWEKVPYASADPFVKKYEGATKWESEKYRADGLHGIEPDKIGEMGLAYLYFYQITLEKKYLEAAIDCADALAKHVRNLAPEKSSFIESVTNKSPWPFRLNARTGIIHDEYCSNVIEPVRLFDELIRIADVLKLEALKKDSYENARKIALEWLFSRNGPMITGIWNGYFEDIPGDPIQSNRVHLTPMEVARYLIKNPGIEKDLDKAVNMLVHYVRYAFRTDGIDAIKEQTWCYEPMGSHTARYASICAMWYEQTGNLWFKDEAFRYFNVATYVTDKNGYVAVGHNWPGAWFSDGYSDYVKHFFEGVAAIPEWAPGNENHLLSSSSRLNYIRYNSSDIKYKTFDLSSKEKFRLMKKPKSVLIDGKTLNELKNSDLEGFSWKPLSTGGVLLINKASALEVEIRF